MTNDVIARAQARGAVIRDFSKVDGFDYLAGDADLLRELVAEIQRLQAELDTRWVEGQPRRIEPAGSTAA